MRNLPQIPSLKMNQIQTPQDTLQMGSPTGGNVPSIRYRDNAQLPNSTKNSQFQLKKQFQGQPTVNNIQNFTNYHFEMPQQIVVSSDEVRSLDRIP